MLEKRWEIKKHQTMNHLQDRYIFPMMRKLNHQPFHPGLLQLVPHKILQLGNRLKNSL